MDNDDDNDDDNSRFVEHSESLHKSCSWHSNISRDTAKVKSLKEIFERD